MRERIVSAAKAGETDLKEIEEVGVMERTSMHEKMTVAGTIDAAAPEETSQAAEAVIGTAEATAIITKEEEETPVAATEEAPRVVTGAPQTEAEDPTKEETLSEKEALTKEGVPTEAKKEGPHTRAVKEEVLIEVEIKTGIQIGAQIDMTGEEKDIEEAQEKEEMMAPMIKTEEAEKKENHKPKMDAIAVEETTEPRTVQCTGQDQRANVNTVLMNIQAGNASLTRNKSTPRKWRKQKVRASDCKKDGSRQNNCLWTILS